MTQFAVQVLATEGTLSTGLYLIASGECGLSAKLRDTNSTQKEGPGRSFGDVAILGSCQFFGEESFFVRNQDRDQTQKEKWITILEYKRQVACARGKKDRVVKIPATVHQYSVVALSSV